MKKKKIKDCVFFTKIFFKEEVEKKQTHFEQEEDKTKDENSKEKVFKGRRWCSCKATCLKAIND